MAEKLILVRHGETEWSKSGQHTSVTDLALTERGEQAASALGPRLEGLDISAVLTSPRKRAEDTAALALPDVKKQVLDDLAEWNYGEYEGLTSQEILDRDPDWVLWTRGCPGGESPDDVQNRCKKLITRAEETPGTIAYFAHGHILRALMVNWLGLSMAMGERIALETSSVSELGWVKGARSLIYWNT